MTPLVQGCIVVVTLAVVVLAYFASRMMFRIEATTKKLEVGLTRLDEILEDLGQTSKKVREVVGVLDQIADTVHSGVRRIEGLVERATSVGSTVIDEIGRPVLNVLGVIRGIQAGVRALTDRWTNGREPAIQKQEGESHV